MAAHSERKTPCRGPFIDPDHTKSHLKLITRAIKKQWNVRPEIRARFVDEAAVIFFDPNRDTKERLVAGRLILAADGYNLKARELRLRARALRRSNQQPASALNMQINDSHRAQDMIEDEMIRHIQTQMTQEQLPANEMTG